MAAHAAVGIDDDLAAGQTAVSHRTADNKTASRIDEITGIGIQQFGRNYFFDNLFQDAFFDLLVGHVGSVLGRDNNRIDTDRLVVDILNRNLGFGIGTQESELARFAHFSQFGHQFVGQLNRHRHQLWGFVAGITEHQTLVTGALLLVEAFADRNTLGNVR